MHVPHACALLSLIDLLFSTILLEMSTRMQKPRKLRIPAIFKRGRSSSTQDQSASGNHPESAIPAAPGKIDKARDRYEQAAGLLEDALKGENERWRNFEIPKLIGECESTDPVEFKKTLESLSQAYSENQDRNLLKKCVHAIECCFTALIPFMKNVLEIAKEGSAVATLTNFN